MALSDHLTGALVLGPMTKGSNLPYRRLCVELGARVTVSEMTVARRLRQRRKGEFALIRRFDGEPCFGVQLAGTNAEDLGWAAALVEARGADFVDLNCGCPIDHFTHKGLGASLGRQPSRQRRLVETMKRAVTRIPVTAKIRLGTLQFFRLAHHGRNNPRSSKAVRPAGNFVMRHSGFLVRLAAMLANRSKRRLMATPLSRAPASRSTGSSPAAIRVSTAAAGNGTGTTWRPARRRSR